MTRSQVQEDAGDSTICVIFGFSGAGGARSSRGARTKAAIGVGQGLPWGMKNDAYWMEQAIAAARRGIAGGQSPFGAVIVRGDELVADTHNIVWRTTDPTAHAEVTCIREACRRLGVIKLGDCRMFTTCEPCPMCASAIHWSGLASVAYGATIADAEGAGFSELRMACAELLGRGGSPVKVESGMMQRECAGVFEEWKRAGGRAY